MQRIFLAIPTISMWTYLPALVNSRLLQAKIISLLGMTSLVATTYLLIYVPNTKPSATDRRPLSARFEREPSPIHKHLGSLNVGLSVLVALNSITFRGRVGVHDGFWILCLLPGGKASTPFHTEGTCIDPLVVVLSIIVMARRVMLSVDVGELESLKYEYKGA